MLLMIDNYDSFTYNLVQYFSELGCEVLVKRNDKITIEEIRQLNPQWIVISPGPCTPDEAGISVDIVKELSHYPILGVCLGHQSIAQAFAGKVTHAKEIMHGKISTISHNQQGLFKDIPSPIKVTRYHSLIADSETLPDCLLVTSQIQNSDGSLGEIMSFKHKTKQIYGVQFHPESILTEYGHKMLNNFLKLS